MKLGKEQSREMVKNHYLALAEEKLEHAGRVRKISGRIADRLEKQGCFCVDRPLLLNAAQLHDIAKLDNDRKHHKKAKKAIKKEYRKLTGEKLAKRDRKRLGAVIQAHKGSFDPPDHVALEAAVLRMADKIDQTARGKRHAKKSYKKHMKKIKDSGCFDRKKDYKRFKKACKKVLKHAKDDFKA